MHWWARGPDSNRIANQPPNCLLAAEQRRFRDRDDDDSGGPMRINWERVWHFGMKYLVVAAATFLFVSILVIG
jgi:hypothetical protein